MANCTLTSMLPTFAVFPMQQNGKARLIGSIRDDAAKDNEHLRFEDVQGLAVAESFGLK